MQDALGGSRVAGFCQGMAATAATGIFQSSPSKLLPSREANKGAAVTAWGSNQIISPCLGDKINSSHSAVKVVGEA